MIADLHWVADTMEMSSGLFFFNTTECTLTDADTIIFCDASMMGLDFYCLELNIAYHADIANTVPTCTIFFYKALAVLSALSWTLNSLLTIHHLLIYTDSMNTVEMFH